MESYLIIALVEFLLGVLILFSMLMMKIVSFRKRNKKGWYTSKKLYFYKVCGKLIPRKKVIVFLYGYIIVILLVNLYWYFFIR